MNVNEQIYLYFCKDEDALVRLIEHYRPMVKGILRHRSLAAREAQKDLLVQADKLLVDSLHNYRPDASTHFTTYYRTVIHHHTADHLRHELKNRMQYHFDVVPLDEMAREGRVTLQEAIPDQRQAVHELAVARATLHSIYAQCDREEQKVLDLRMKGCSYQEIGDAMGIGQRRVRYLLKRSGQRYRKSLEDFEKGKAS